MNTDIYVYVFVCLFRSVFNCCETDVRSIDVYDVGMLDMDMFIVAMYFVEF